MNHPSVNRDNFVSSFPVKTVHLFPLPCGTRQDLCLSSTVLKGSGVRRHRHLSPLSGSLRRAPSFWSLQGSWSPAWKPRVLLTRGFLNRRSLVGQRGLALHTEEERALVQPRDSDWGALGCGDHLGGDTWTAQLALVTVSLQWVLKGGYPDLWGGSVVCVCVSGGLE